MAHLANDLAHRSGTEILQPVAYTRELGSDTEIGRKRTLHRMMDLLAAVETSSSDNERVGMAISCVSTLLQFPDSVKMQNDGDEAGLYKGCNYYCKSHSVHTKE